MQGLVGPYLFGKWFTRSLEREKSPRGETPFIRGVGPSVTSGGLTNYLGEVRALIEFPQAQFTGLYLSVQKVQSPYFNRLR